MGERRYMISDAAKLVDVESHVLRYWEEELDIEIPRNEMGHRYYEEVHIDLLKNVKELKDCGYQLKAIKMLIPELMEMQKKQGGNLDALKAELFGKVAKVSMAMDVEEPQWEAAKVSMGEDLLPKTDAESLQETEEQAGRLPGVQAAPPLSKQTPISGSKLEQFQMILSEVVSSVIKESTGELGREVSDIVSDNVLREMDYLMHIREKQEEERFRKLDETIRSYQNQRKEQGQKNRWPFSKTKKIARAKKGLSH